MNSVSRISISNGNDASKVVENGNGGLSGPTRLAAEHSVQRFFGHSGVSSLRNLNLNDEPNVKGKGLIERDTVLLMRGDPRVQSFLSYLQSNSVS
jgi:hypothetical protein